MIEKSVISFIHIMESSDKFNFQEAVHTVTDALGGVVCNIFFEAALHGLGVAAVVFLLGLSLKNTRRALLAKPMMLAASKLAIACLVLSIPGIICLVLTGGLPSTGFFETNSLGYIGFWSLVSVWLCGESINYQWFSPQGDREIRRHVETSAKSSTSESL